MAAPSYENASTGATDAGGVWSYTISITGNAAGKVYILQALQDGATAGAVALTGATTIENLAGTDNAWTAIPGPNADGSWPVGATDQARQFLWIGRGIGTGNPNASGTNSTSEDLYFRGYRFGDVATGTTLATVIENGSAGTAVNGVGTSATAADTGVTTLGPDRLALNFVAVNDDNAISAFTGETGGDWTLAVSPYAESSGTDGAIALQAAAMATAGTIDGGTSSIVDIDAWGVVGFALIGTTVADTTYYPRHPAHDFGSVTNF